MDRQTWGPVKERTKRLLIAASIAVSIHGCAAPSGNSSVNGLPNTTPTTPIAGNWGEDRAAEKSQNDRQATSAKVRVAGYHDRTLAIVAAPAAFGQPPQEEGSSRFVDFLQRDPTVPESAGDS